MALDFTALNAELARDADVVTSAVTLINRLLADVEAAKGDPAAVQAVVDAYKAQTDALAAAVAAGTPVDPSGGDKAKRR